MSKKAPVKIHRAPDPSMLLNNKLYIDGVAYPGDVIVGYAEKHSPLRWIEVKDINIVHVTLKEEVGKTENSYIPCHPPLLCKETVAMKRKDGSIIIIAGSIPPYVERVKAHLLHERDLFKGKLHDTYLLLARQMEGMTADKISSLSQMAHDIQIKQKEQLAQYEDL